MNNDKITDEEIAALDGDLIELGQNFLDNGDGQRALKCFLRAAEPDKSRFEKIIGLSIVAEIYRDGLGGVPVDGHKAIELYQKIGGYSSDFEIAEIYEEGCGDLLADGYKALEIYREMIRSIEIFVQSRWNFCGDSGVEFAVTENYLGEDYPEYIQALRGQAEIYRQGLGGVSVDGRKALKYYKRIVEIIFGTLDIHSLDDDEKFKRIRADGKVDHLYAVRALADIANMYRYGEAGIRPNPRKAEKIYELATYLDHEYLIDENFRSWRRNEDEREFD